MYARTLPERQDLGFGDAERGEAAGIVVGREARVRGPVHGFRDPFVVAEHQAPGRATKLF